MLPVPVARSVDSSKTDCSGSPFETGFLVLLSIGRISLCAILCNVLRKIVARLPFR